MSTLPVEVVVTAVSTVTPRMRRVTFAGEGVRTYLSGDCEPNVKLFFPDGDAPLDLPVWANGYQFQGSQRARVRTYTVRRADRAAGEMDVDFVRHGHGDGDGAAGLAAAWAERAQPGDVLGVLGGGGLTIGRASWILLVGDEAALPAMAAIIARRPVDQRGVVLVEVADEAERQDLHAPAGLDVRWLYRNGAAPGSTTLLIDALREVELPVGAEDVRVWVSGESQLALAARKHLKDKGFDRRRQLVIGYWHKGWDEVTYARTTDHDRVDDELTVDQPAEVHEHSHAH
ncbi:siderophore-interacting protein [Rhodococcus sp. X156]|uniref:siderophore-interacting protein n=1 Tax=Rhodococcus sp. X156 TaxID=2499145 RepID=UPI000FDBDBFD|nr:siderophore-interacting protein [Rhodococcus sp. X156]